MSEVTSYEAGMPAWVDLTTTEPAGSRRFYGDLFGWEFRVGPPDIGHYTACLTRGHKVAGIAGEPAPDDTPTAWTTYLASGDVGDAADRIIDIAAGQISSPCRWRVIGRWLARNAGDLMPAGQQVV